MNIGDRVKYSGSLTNLADNSLGDYLYDVIKNGVGTVVKVTHQGFAVWYGIVLEPQLPDPIPADWLNHQLMIHVNFDEVPNFTVQPSHCAVFTQLTDVGEFKYRG